jgi:hypothetical protein
MKEGLRRSGATAEALNGEIRISFLGVTRVGGNLYPVFSQHIRGLRFSQSVREPIRKKFVSAVAEH